MIKKYFQDANGVLYQSYFNPNTDNIEFKCCSPIQSVNSINEGDLKLLKRNTFFKLRGEQWRKNYKHTWFYNSIEYMTGETFKTLNEALQSPQHQIVVSDFIHEQDAILVYRLGLLYYAVFFPNSDNFILYDIYTKEQCCWANHRILQPIYRTDNLQQQ